MAGKRRPQSWLFAMCKECESVFRVFPSQINECCSVDYLRSLSRRMSDSPQRKSISRLQSIWSSMKSRCLRETSAAYDYYGGRGISICDEWIMSSSPFIEWAIANGYRDDLSLDWRDVNGNYCPENCRWATRAQQSMNTRTRSNNKTSQFKGVSRCKNDEKWRVQLHKSGKPVHGGMFVSEIDAAKKYDEMAIAMYGEYASLNFPNRNKEGA